VNFEETKGRVVEEKYKVGDENGSSWQFGGYKWGF
jgi:hypothetical protein